MIRLTQGMNSGKGSNDSGIQTLKIGGKGAKDMKWYNLFLTALACLANVATTTTVNSACNLILYEPEILEELVNNEKLYI